MSETLTAVRQELALSRDSVLWGSGTAADRPRIYIVGSSTSPTLDEARERVRQAVIASREDVARTFAERMSGFPFVHEVWLSDNGDEAVVHTIVEGVSLDHDLELEAIFTAVLGERNGSFNGYHHIHTLEEGVPAEARNGLKLFPE